MVEQFLDVFICDGGGTAHARFDAIFNLLSSWLLKPATPGIACHPFGI